jgi:hypothetical protein
MLSTGNVSFLLNDMSTDQNVPFFTEGVLLCPNCKQAINVAAGVTPGHSGKVKKGGIVICSGCAGPSIVGDSGLEALTKERFQRLDPLTQKSIQAVCKQLRFNMSENPPLN